MRASVLLLCESRSTDPKGKRFIFHCGDAEIIAYENDEDEMLVSVFFGYAKLVDIPVEI